MESLRKLGLTVYEVAVYSALLKNGKLNAGEISEQSNVPQTAVYPNLKTLIKKQLIQKIEAEPSLFEVLPPTQSIINLLEKKKTTLNTLKEQFDKEAEEILKEKPILEEKEVIRLTRGKTFSSEFYKEAIKRVTKTFYVLGWRFEKVGDRYNFLKEFKKIIDKGVDVRIIVTGFFEKNLELMKAYQLEGVKLKFYPLDNFSIIVVDEKECKITLKNREFSEKYNLHIIDSSLAQALNTYFLDTWKKAQDIRSISHTK